MRTLYLIDANSLIHRAYHALPPFTAPGGEPTGALYGLASILLKLIREERPEYAAALFDRPEPTYREKEYAAYKAQRPPIPNDLIAQIVEARDLFARFGIQTIEHPGFEADDLIATLARRFGSAKDLRVVILTGDMDTLQLVKDSTVVVRSLKKGISDTTTYDEKAVLDRYGIAPQQVIDYKALVGDPSDNIKGVPGVGPKTATALLTKFGSLQGILDHLEGDAALKAKLFPWRAQALLCKRLVTLREDAPIVQNDIEALAVSFDTQALSQELAKLGFKTLVERLSAMVSSKQSLFE